MDVNKSNIGYTSFTVFAKIGAVKIREGWRRTGNNNFLRRHAFKGHLLMKKSNKQKRKLSQVLCVKKSEKLTKYQLQQLR